MILGVCFSLRFLNLNRSQSMTSSLFEQIRERGFIRSYGEGTIKKLLGRPGYNFWFTKVTGWIMIRQKKELVSRHVGICSFKWTLTKGKKVHIPLFGTWTVPGGSPLLLRSHSHDFYNLSSETLLCLMGPVTEGANTSAPTALKLCCGPNGRPWFVAWPLFALLVAKGEGEGPCPAW